MLERKRQQNRAGKQRAGGALPTFTTWMKGEDKSTAGVQYTTTDQATVLAMRARAAAKGHAGEVMTKDLLNYLLSPTRKNAQKHPASFRQSKTTKWCAKWD